MRTATANGTWLALIVFGVSMTCCGKSGAQARSYGTAFAVTDDGIYVTCAHLVKDKGEILLRPTYSAKIVAMDEDNDLALLRATRKVFRDKSDTIENEPLAGQEYLQIASSSHIGPGQKVFVGSFPNYEVDYKVQSRSYEGIIQFGPIALLKLRERPMYPSSGGPVVDTQGRVIGVTRLVGRHRDTAIPSEHLLALLKAAGVKLREPGQIEPSKVIERIEKSLAFIDGETRPAVDYGRDRVVISGADATTAEQIVAFFSNHGWQASFKPGRILIPFSDKRFGSFALLRTRVMPIYAQSPSLIARVSFDLKRAYWQGPRAAEVVRWADEMERQYPSLSIHTNAQHGLTIEQTLSFNEVMTWSELSTSVGSFRDMITILAQGPGLNGFKKYLPGFENLVRMELAG